MRWRGKEGGREGIDSAAAKACQQRLFLLPSLLPSLTLQPASPPPFILLFLTSTAAPTRPSSLPPSLFPLPPPPTPPPSWLFLFLLLFLPLILLRLGRLPPFPPSLQSWGREGGKLPRGLPLHLTSPPFFFEEGRRREGGRKELRVLLPVTLPLFPRLPQSLSCPRREEEGRQGGREGRRGGTRGA